MVHGPAGHEVKTSKYGPFQRYLPALESPAIYRATDCNRRIDIDHLLAPKARRPRLAKYGA